MENDELIEKYNLNPEKRDKKAYITKKLSVYHVKDLVERTDHLNKTDDKFQYPHRIENLIIFGSFLSNKEILGDIDIIFDYKSRWDKPIDEQDYFWDKPSRNCWSLAIFNSYNFTKKLLRNKKRSFSFHTAHEFETLLKIPEFRYVYLIKDYVINNEWEKEAELFYIQNPINKICES
jgi:hypothetical protein